MTNQTLCRSCSRLQTCELLGVPPKTDVTKVITEEDVSGDHEVLCEKWRSASPMLRAIRRAAYEMSGLSAIKAVRVLTKPELRETEVAVVDYLPEEELKAHAQVIRDLAGDSVAYKVRRDQLQYRTDPSGRVLLDSNGQPMPRDGLELCNYAIRGLGMESEVVCFWRPPQLIPEILKKEQELGIVVSADQKRKLDKGTPKQAYKEEPIMGKTINIKRSNLSSTQQAVQSEAPPAGATTGPKLSVPKLGRPLTRRPLAAAPQATTYEAAPEAAPGQVQAVVDLSYLSGALEGIVTRLDQLDARISQLGEKLTADTSVMLTDVVQKVNAGTVEAVTILHDVLMQTITDSSEHNLIENGLDVTSYRPETEPDSGN